MRKRTHIFHALVCFILLSVLSPLSVAWAQQAELYLELNTAEDLDQGCQLTFVVHNISDEDIRRLVMETVFFGQDGGVKLLTLFDFATIPMGIPRVRQFIVADQACTELGQILINGINQCDGPIDPNVCGNVLRLNSRSDIAFIG